MEVWCATPLELPNPEEAGQVAERPRQPLLQRVSVSGDGVGVWCPPLPVVGIGERDHPDPHAGPLERCVPVGFGYPLAEALAGLAGELPDHPAV